MAPIPEPQVPASFDSDDEESLLILASVGHKCYSEQRAIDHDLSASNWDADEEISYETRNGCLSHMWKVYFSALQRRPLLVKSITALFLMALADFLAQLVQHLRGIPDPAWVDLLRISRFGVFGLLGAPWTHYYYDWLDRTLPPTPKPWTMTTAGEEESLGNLVCTGRGNGHFMPCLLEMIGNQLIHTTVTQRAYNFFFPPFSESGH